MASSFSKLAWRKERFTILRSLDISIGENQRGTLPLIKSIPGLDRE
jgi:hypothetical protein